MAYATIQDVKDRYTVEFDEDRCAVLLNDAAVLIDSINANASTEAKLVVSCNMVIRVLGMNEEVLPLGTTQGTMSALGYSQTFTLGSGGGSGELYLSKTDKRLLGASNKIAMHSPMEDCL